MKSSRAIKVSNEQWSVLCLKFVIVILIMPAIICCVRKREYYCIEITAPPEVALLTASSQIRKKP